MTSPYTTPQLTRGDLIKAALTIIALVIGLWALWHTRLLIILTVLGALLGIAVKPAVDWLETRRVRRGVGAPMVVLGAIGSVLLVMLWSGPTLVTEFNQLWHQLPRAVDRIDAYFAQNEGSVLEALLPKATVDTIRRPQGDSVVTQPASTRLKNALSGQAGAVRGVLFGALTSTFAVLAGMVYVLFLTVYFAIEPGVYRRGVLLLVPLETRDRAARVFDVVTQTLRKWLATQFIAMVVVWLVTTAMLLILGVKSAIPLGILAGVFEFIPNVGPMLSAIPGVLLAFAESPQQGLIVALAYWGIQFLENNLLIPYLMREELDLPPALTLIWQALMAIIFGLLGLFVAVPLLAATFVAIRYLYVRGDVPPVHKSRGSRMLMMPVDPSAA
ncbi:MAG TPA: AI-2E family transporter [Gemmatimonadaceae bacterium]|nr:AI-2E family transporter [Gemmatimonadaceae bacterium]